MRVGLRRFWQLIWSLTAIYWVFICVMTHLPPDKVPRPDVSDKTEHLVAYGLLTGAIHLSLWPRRWSVLRTAIFVLVGIMVYGALDEITQPIFGRTCDIFDWLADVSGCGIALIVMSLAKFAMPRSPAADDAVGSPVQREG